MNVLTPEQFDLLTEDEQSQYLAALHEQVGGWHLTGKQLEADALADRVDALLYGGAAGGGKSEWLMHRANRLSIEIPGHSSLILRSSFPELRRSIIRRSVVLYASNAAADRPKWRSSDKEWLYPNGSVIEMGYCESDEDVGQFLSAEYDFVAFDELTEFSLYQFDMIGSRARTTKAKKALGARPHVVGASNPGRRGHAWVKSMFVEGTDHGRVKPAYATGQIDDGTYRTAAQPSFAEDERIVGFTPSTVADNPHIDPAYVKRLLTMPEALKRQYLEGDWDVFEGQYFNEFKQLTVDSDGNTHPHHVIEPFDIPYTWPRIRCIDWGYTAPFCCLWLAFDENGICYVYREAYAVGLTPEEQAQLVKRMSIARDGDINRAEKIDYTMADPASWAQRGSGYSIAQQWLTAKLQCRKADNDRIAGWQRMREYLKADREGEPGIRIFNTCTNLVRTIPLMIHDKNKAEDLDTTLEDHAVDALRYGLMSRPRRFTPAKQGIDLSTADGRAYAHLKRMERPRKTKKNRVQTELGGF